MIHQSFGEVLLRKPLRGFLGLNPRCGASTRFHQGFDKC